MTVVLSRKGFDSKAGGMYSPLLSTGEYALLPRPETEKTANQSYRGVDYADIPTDFPGFGNLMEILEFKHKVPDYGAHLDPDLVSILPVKDWKPAFGQRGSAQGYLTKRGVGMGSKGALFLFFSRFRPWEKTDKGLMEGYYIYGWLEVGRTIDPNEGGDQFRYHPHFTGRYRDTPNNILYVASDRITGTNLPGAGMFGRLTEHLRLSHHREGDLLRWRLPACCLGSFSRLRDYARLRDDACTARWPQSYGQDAVCSTKTVDQEAVEQVRGRALGEIQRGMEKVGVKEGCL